MSLSLRPAAAPKRPATQARGSLSIRTRIAALSAAALVALTVCACATPPDASIPVFEVESRPFQHRVTAEGRLQATHSTKLSVPSEVERAVRLAWLANEGTHLSSGDVVARFDAKAMTEKLEDGQRDLRSSDLEIERTDIESQVTLTSLRKDLRVADIELEHARSFQKVDDQVFSRRDIQEDAIDEFLAEDRKQHAEMSADTQRSLSKTERELLEIQRRQAQITIEQAQTGLQALEIIAPHDGVLTLTRNWRGEPPRVGLEMWRGQELGEIPDLSKMEAQVYVLEADAGGLGEGKDAEVVIEAFPDRVFPAKITSVEAVAQPRFRGSPVQYFGVVLEFETTDIEVMKPGARVRAKLFLEQRDEAVVVPRQAIFRNGPEARVFVRNGRKFEPRKVQVGPTSLGSVVVESGLEPGEVVALAKPTSAGEGVDDTEDPVPDEKTMGSIETAGSAKKAQPTQKTQPEQTAAAAAAGGR